MSPAKKKRARAKSALRKLRLLTEYHIAAAHAKLFAEPFWWSEQWRSRILDRLHNEGIWR
jgi:hypothetical protein